MPCADSKIIWARRQVTTDPVPRRMIRTDRIALVVVEWTHSYSFCHPPRLTGVVSDTSQPGGVSPNRAKVPGHGSS